MAFAVRVNGEEVKRFDEQVVGVKVRTAHGEAAAVGISDVGIVDIIVETVGVLDPTRLDVLEAMKAEERRKFWDEHEGESTGPIPEVGDVTLGERQNILGENIPIEEPQAEEPPAEQSYEEAPAF